MLTSDVSAYLIDRVAVVTGAGRGIGAATARLLGKMGARVVANYLSDPSGAEEVAARIRAEGGSAVAIQGDVANERDVRRLADETATTFGPATILVCNAAPPNERKSFAELLWSDCQSQFDGVVRSAFYCMRELLPGMVDAQFGRVICIGTAGVIQPTAGSHAYIAAKSALYGLVKTVALEYGRAGITVNVVEPGLTDTRRAASFTSDFRDSYVARVPVGRIGSPDDVARAVGFLASPTSSFITGTTIRVNGGVLMG